jgi:hypothetical protein
MLWMRVNAILSINVTIIVVLEQGYTVKLKYVQSTAINITIYIRYYHVSGV